MADLIDFNLLDQIATLVWAHTGDSTLAYKLATVKLASGLWERLSNEKETEALRTEAILRIAKYVKEHPKASKEELTQEIGRQITAFAEKVEQV